jgi:hypothetical protein
VPGPRDHAHQRMVSAGITEPTAIFEKENLG